MVSWVYMTLLDREVDQEVNRVKKLERWEQMNREALNKMKGKGMSIPVRRSQFRHPSWLGIRRP